MKISHDHAICCTIATVLSTAILIEASVVKTRSSSASTNVKPPSSLSSPSTVQLTNEKIRGNDLVRPLDEYGDDDTLSSFSFSFTSLFTRPSPPPKNDASHDDNNNSRTKSTNNKKDKSNTETIIAYDNNITTLERMLRYATKGLIHIGFIVALPFVSIDYAWSFMTSKMSNNSSSHKKRATTKQGYWGKAKHGLQLIALFPLALHALPFALLSQLKIKDEMFPFLQRDTNREEEENYETGDLHRSYWNKAFHGLKDTMEVILAITCLPFVWIDQIKRQLIIHVENGEEQITEKDDNNNNHFWKRVIRGMKNVVEAPFAILLLPFVGIHKAVVTSPSSLSLLDKRKSRGNETVYIISNNDSYWKQGVGGLLDVGKASAAAICLPFVFVDKMVLSIPLSSLLRHNVNGNNTAKHDEKAKVIKTYWSHAKSGVTHSIQALMAIPAMPFFVADQIWSKLAFQNNDTHETHNINFWDKSLHGVEIVAKAPLMLATSPFLIFDSSSFWCRATHYCCCIKEEEEGIDSNSGVEKQHYWKRVKRGVLNLLHTPFVLAALPFVWVDMIQEHTPSLSLPHLVNGDKEEKEVSIVIENIQLHDEHNVISNDDQDNKQRVSKICSNIYWHRARQGGTQVALIPAIFFALPLVGVDIVWSNVMEYASNHFHSNAFSCSSQGPTTTSSSTITASRTFWDQAMRGGCHILCAPIMALASPFAGWGSIVSWMFSEQKQQQKKHFGCHNANNVDHYWSIAYIGGRALLGFILSPFTLIGYTVRSTTKHIQGQNVYDGRYDKVTWVGYAGVPFEASHNGAKWISDHFGAQIWSKKGTVFRWLSGRMSSIQNSICRASS